MVLRLQVKMALDGQTKQMEKNLYILMICLYFKNKDTTFCMNTDRIIKRFSTQNKYLFYIKILFITKNHRKQGCHVHRVLMKSGCETRNLGRDEKRETERYY